MSIVADFIRKRREEILSAWVQDAGRRASARGLTGPAFSGIMPEYLSSLAEAGEQLGTFSGDRRKYVESHFASRLRQGFVVAEIVEEFAILGHCISRIWALAPPQEQPELTSIAGLYHELHLASAAAVEMFNRHMLEDEQTEKRYLRLIQGVASEALHGDGEIFTLRLGEVLKLLLESVDAQSVALLLYDAESRKLVTAVSTGVAHEELKRYAVSVDPTSFAAQSAGTERVPHGDTDSRELTVPESLMSHGINSLLGVRLTPRHKWLELIYVAHTKQHAFTARQLRRIESLATWLLIHLDNAYLYAGLKETIQALQTERALREQFVSILAHDLRGPLAAARLITQLLIRHPERMDERRDMAIRLDSNLERTDHMVRDLLDANRIRAGERLPLRLDACDLSSVAKEVVSEISALHGERVVLKAGERIHGIWSGEELRRAIWNLAMNAVKYGAPDQPITVTVEHMDIGAKVSVHNYGPVIAKEEQARLCEPFVRARSAEVGASTGWGLGLTLVRGCAEAHGGRLFVESDTTSGTTFTIALPLDSRHYQPRSDSASAPK